MLGQLIAFKRLIPKGDAWLGCCVLAQLSVMILPLPTILLDVALAMSFTLSILILMVALALRRPLDFSSFPVLLLLTTIFRLSLNVATARIILAHGAEGPMAAGHVVAAFGGFLMGGDVIVGLIIFLMLLMVNFVVITKGSSRIAEVSARFYLDSMPGKQMAIDADLSSGNIDEKTARLRRAELEEESGFYGAMDGASKFVRGDAIAALVITFINITGGLLIGMFRSQMSVEDAVATFTTLTIGDGLVSQIPSLLVSTAAGIVVAKGATEGRMQGALIAQLGSNPHLLAITAGASGVLAVMPGLPTLPFMMIAIIAGGGAWLRSAQKRTAQNASSPDPQLPQEAPFKVARIDLIRVELGYGLLELASGTGTKLPEQIKSLRRSMASDLGFVLPAVRIQDNVDLEPYKYVLALKDINAGTGELRPTMLLAINAGDQNVPIQGEKTVDPAFGLPAYWIEPALEDQARSINCTIVDPASVLTTHLSEIIKDNITELLSYPETQKLIADLPSEQQKLVSELVPAVITIGGLQRVLQALLGERISIRDMATILEAIQEACGGTAKTLPSIVAHVRTRLSRQITDSHTGSAGYVAVISLSNEWEEILGNALVGPAEDRQLALSQDKLQDFIDRLRTAVELAGQMGERPVLLTSGQIRYQVYSLLERTRISTPVIAQSEVHRRARIKIVARV